MFFAAKLAIATLLVPTLSMASEHRMADRYLKLAINSNHLKETIEIRTKIETAFGKHGYQIRWADLPMNRALFEAASGNIDGVAMRQHYAIDNFTSLLPINHPVYNAEFWVLKTQRKSCGKIQELPSQRPVGILGYKYFDLIYSRSDVGFHQVSRPDKVLAMLESGRADYTVAPKSLFQLSSQRMNIHLKSCFNRPLIEMDFFTFLNEKHRDILPQLTATYESLFET